MVVEFQTCGCINVAANSIQGSNGGGHSLLPDSGPSTCDNASCGRKNAVTADPSKTKSHDVFESTVIAGIDAEHLKLKMLGYENLS